jgi:hypothetical protein
MLMPRMVNRLRVLRLRRFFSITYRTSIAAQMLPTCDSATFRLYAQYEAAGDGKPTADSHASVEKLTGVAAAVDRAAVRT